MRSLIIREKLERIKAVRESILERIEKLAESLKKEKTYLGKASNVLLILQDVAQRTQQQFEYRISELVSLALSAVFENPYELKLSYELKRNKTEASLKFFRNEKLVDPLNSSGYGAVDIAGFGLRCALMSLSQKELDKVLILDEPFKNLSKEYIPKAALMIKEISEKLGLQIIMVTHTPEFAEAADKIFKVSIKNKVSEIQEI